MGCAKCGHQIGRIEKFKIRIATRVFRKASAKFHLGLDVEKYAHLCQGCMLKTMQERVENLKVDVYNDMHKTGKTQEELVAEVKKFVEEEAPREARKVRL